MHSEFSHQAARIRFDELSQGHHHHHIAAADGFDLHGSWFRRPRSGRRPRGRPLAPVVSLAPRPPAPELVRDDQRIA